MGSSVPASESDSGGRRQNAEWPVLGSSLILTKGWEMMAHPSGSLLAGPQETPGQTLPFGERGMAE